MPPTESSSATGVEDKPEDAWTKPCTDTPPATSLSEGGAQPVHVSPNSQHPAEQASLTENRQTAVAVNDAGRPGGAPGVAEKSVPTADQSEVADDKLRLHESANATGQLHCYEDKPEEVATTNVEEACGVEPQMSAAKTPPEASADARPGSTLPPTAYKVSQPVTPEPKVSEARPERKRKEPPKYPGPRTAPLVLAAGMRTPPTPALSADQDSELHLRVHLVFGRRGSSVRNLSLVPEWRPGIPPELEVTGTQGDFVCCRLGGSCQDVVLADIGAALRGGVVWHHKGSPPPWRWVLGGREMYVLARGDDAGLSGFVSVPRLVLGAEHVVLATTRRREDVLAALTQAGCAQAEIMDETVEGVPAGWLLFRGVMPARAVQGSDDADILNALRPVAEIAPHFVGGIRLKWRTWLLGHPPHIRFTGDISGQFEVRIDRESASISPEGGYIAPGWDKEGRHSLWYAGRLSKYLLMRGTEQWSAWSAYDFGTGAAICGACTLPQNEALGHQVRVLAHNPVLIGAVPGQIVRCNLRADMQSDALALFVPFAPVWALPADPLHADKRTARIMPANSLQRVRMASVDISSRAAKRAVFTWCAAINEAGCKRLALAIEDVNAVVLWQEYRRAAKKIWGEIR
jgi:hypothetical protein